MADEHTVPLADEFTLKLLDGYREAVEACNYRAKAYLGMLGELGGVGSAKALLGTNKPSDGFYVLWKCGRLDLTLEAAISDNPQWHCLFTQAELDEAHRRLEELSYYQ